MGVRSAIFNWLQGDAKPAVARPGRRMYQGATVGRLNSDWVTSSTSADSEIKGSLSRLRNRSRQLVRDSDYARQAIRAVKNNVVGTGIKMQAQVRMLRGAGRLDQPVNDAIEAAWKVWGKKQFCHTGGRLSWHEIERLAIGAMAESGEVFLRKVRQPFGGGKVPFALEVIESDLLDDTYNGKSTVDGNEWRMGVECDKWGRPITYAFLNKHPGDSPFQGQPGARHKLISADEIIHLYLCDRPGQTRGVPWLATAIQRLHHLQGYEEAEVIRARASSSLMGFITNSEGELAGDDVYEGERVSSFEPGVFKYLAPGESVTVPQLDAPDGQFEPFLRSMLRALAAGVGCSYESVSRDFSQTNYSSSRLSLLEDRDHWRVLQQYLVDNLHQPVFEAWLEMAVLGGAINLPLYETDPERYRQVRWMPRGWAWVDPGKEVQAYKDAVRCGFKTLGEVVAEQGGDLEELMMARAAELELADQLDLTFDTDPHEVNAAGVEQPSDPAEDTTEEQPNQMEAVDSVNGSIDNADDQVQAIA